MLVLFSPCDTSLAICEIPFSIPEFHSNEIKLKILQMKHSYKKSRGGFSMQHR